MSSTNRGRARNDSDNYPTAPWILHRFLETCTSAELPGGRWLEPCAGDGKIIQAVNDKRDDIRWSTVELRPEMKEHLLPLTKGFYYAGNLLSLNLDHFHGRKFDVAITNPPFALAEQVIRKCMELSHKTVMLLRLNYWGSEERHAFMTQYPPDVYVLPQRPVFAINKKGKAGTDSVEYAFFVWRSPDSYFDEEPCGKIRLLGLTPKAERKEWSDYLKANAPRYHAVPFVSRV